MKLKGLKKGLSITTFALLGTMITGTIIANENASAISNFFGSKTFEYVQDSSANSQDSIYYKSKYSKIGDVSKNNQVVADQVCAEGTVLLKNENNALPLDEGSSVSMVGMGAYFPVYGGTGSGSVSSAKQVDYVQSMKNAGFKVNDTLETSYRSDDWAQYKRGTEGRFGTTTFKINDVPWADVEAAAGSSFTTYGDAAIMVISRVGGEGYDLNHRASDGIDNKDGLGTDYLGLTQVELDTIAGLKKLKADKKIKKIVVVINYAAQIEGEFLNDPDIDAALWTGAPGAGNASFGRVLNGKVNPSGRLADTMYADNAKNPVNANFGWSVYDNAESLQVSTHVGQKIYPEVSLSSYMVYQEGIYLGYKYTETRYEDYCSNADHVGSYNYDEVVARPFGYGLSYSKFETSNIKMEKTGDREYTVSVTVKNTGTRAGKYSVPIYVSKPYDDYARNNNIQVASVDLIDYGKTNEIPANKEETIQIKLDEKYFCSYDAYGAQTYVLMEGDYYICVGGDAHEATNNLLAAKAKNGKTVDTAKMTASGDASKVSQVHLAFDKSKYSVSDNESSLDGTKHQITNLFDEADINRYSGRGDNHVDYYSRDKWDEVSFDMENGYPKLKMTEQMAKEVYSQMPELSGSWTSTVADKYKQPIPTDDGEYPTYGAKNGLTLLSLRYDSNGEPISMLDPAWDSLLDELTWEDTVSLVSNGTHLTMECETIAKPGTRDENGPNGINASFFGGMNAWTGSYSYIRENSAMYAYAQKIGALDSEKKIITEKLDAEDLAATTTAMASNGVIAATFNKELAQEAGDAIGEDALWLGYSGLYGVGLNIHRSSYLGRCSEYYSEDGMLSGLQGGYETLGIESKGCHVYNKHCFLNELENCRHGVSVWLPEQAAREIYLRAFELPITLGGGFNIMSSFSRLGTYSAAASNQLNNGFLRGECGLKGIILTDCYTDMDGSQDCDPYYEQVYGEYYGGCDLPDGSKPQTENHFDKFKTGYSKMAWAMRESAKRICYQTLWSNAVNGMSASTKIKPITPAWQIAVYVIDGVLGAAFVAANGWLFASLLLDKKNN